MSDVMATLLKPLQRHFDLPKSAREEPTLFLGDYIRNLSVYSDDELAEAFDNILNVQEFKSWPTLAVCKKAYTEARKERIAKTQRDAPLARRVDTNALANDLICSDLGREAARNGWITQLHEFCAANRRLPTNLEQAKLVQASKASRERWQEYLTDENGKICKKLIGNIIKTNGVISDRLAAIANGQTDIEDMRG